MAGSECSPNVLAQRTQTPRCRAMPRKASLSSHVRQQGAGPLIAENPQPREGATYADAAAAHVYETGFRNTSTFRLGMLC